MVFRRIVISLTSILLTFMLIIMLVRLFYGKSAFIGLSDVYYIVQDLDLYKPFQEMWNDVSSSINEFGNYISTTSIVDIGSFFQAVGNFFPAFFNMFFIPFKILYYIGYYIFNLGYQIAMFIANVINY